MAKGKSSSLTEKVAPPKGTGTWSVGTVVVLCVLCFFGGLAYLKVSYLQTKLDNHYDHLVEDVNSLEISFNGINNKLSSIENKFENLTIFMRDSFKPALITAVRTAVNDEFNSRDPNNDPAPD